MKSSGTKAAGLFGDLSKPPRGVDRIDTTLSVPGTLSDQYIGSTCRAIRCGGCDTEQRGENGSTLSVRTCMEFVVVHEKCERKVGDFKRRYRPEAEVLQETGEWRWTDPVSIRPLI